MLLRPQRNGFGELYYCDMIAIPLLRKHFTIVKKLLYHSEVLLGFIIFLDRGADMWLSDHRFATAIANRGDGDGRSIAIAGRNVSARECPWLRGFAVSVDGLPQTEATSA